MLYCWIKNKDDNESLNNNIHKDQCIKKKVIVKFLVITQQQVDLHILMVKQFEYVNISFLIFSLLPEETIWLLLKPADYHFTPAHFVERNIPVLLVIARCRHHLCLIVEEIGFLQTFIFLSLDEELGPWHYPGILSYFYGRIKLFNLKWGAFLRWRNLKN